MEKIKSYTDIEQSKKLANILPLESADMVYCAIHNIGQELHHCNVPIFAYASNKDVPCWSLAALLKLLPQKIEHEGNEAELHINSRMTDIWYENDNFIYFGTFAEKLIDACVQLICTLNEKGLL